MRYQLVLWDFDGTLADTLASSLELYNELAMRHGFRTVTDPGAVRGLTPFEFLRGHGIPLAKVPSLVREMRAAHRGRMATTRLFPGLPPVLEALRQSGHRLGILSSNSRENILACLRANQAEALFDPVVGYSRLLGKARPIRRVLKAGRLGGRDVLYVGDEVRDIEAARQTGVAVAAVTWGFNARDLLARHAPDHLIEHPEELLRVLG
jgi:phosphoglycolate phosphatase-like HAD superfamily hydrolase